MDGGGTGTATSFSPAYSNSGELLTGLTAVSSDVSRTTSSPPSVCAGVRYDPLEARKDVSGQAKYVNRHPTYGRSHPVRNQLVFGLIADRSYRTCTAVTQPLAHRLDPSTQQRQGIVQRVNLE